MNKIRVQVGMKGGANRIEHVFQKHEIIIGRADTNDVILKRVTVSKLHCRVMFVNAVLMVGDSGSTNGTFVNNSRVIGWMPVRPTDEVRVGDYILALSVLPATSESTNSRKDKKERTSTGSGKARQKQGEHKTREQKKTKAPPGTAAKRDHVKSPWEVLQIPQGASKSEAKKAYLKLISMYHPDKVDSLGERLKELAAEVTKEINEAWAKIESGRA